MFDIFAWQHILILLAVALVVVGPKDLPKLMHMAGKWAGKARNLASEFKKSFDEMARQSELDDLRKEVEAMRADHRNLTQPLTSDYSAPSFTARDEPLSADAPAPQPVMLALSPEPAKVEPEPAASPKPKTARKPRAKKPTPEAS